MAQFEASATFVGADACRSCHEAEHESFQAKAKKAHSYDSIKKMQPRLTPAEFRQCFRCHTTGYGQPGGFRSEQETPGLKNAGCEVCHGPGSRHVETARAEDIRGKVSSEVCESCHNSERVEVFRFRPLVFGGGH